jgi:hypothetical protein
VRPLLVKLMHDRVRTSTCTQRLIHEAELGSCLNCTLLAGGVCAVLTSGGSGDGTLRMFPAESSALPPCAAETSDVLLPMPPRRPTALPLPAGQAVIGWVEARGGIVGIAVGEALGFGAALHTWLPGAPETTCPLEFSETLGGQNPMAHAELALFKCRATHYYEKEDAGVIRTCVHNASLSSERQALVAAWDAATGKFLESECTWLRWDGGGDENAAPALLSVAGSSGLVSAPSGLRDDKKRFGGLSCAFASGDTLATGHARDTDGVARVRLWHARTGTLLNILDGPALPAKAFNATGFNAVSFSGDWVVGSSADSNVHVWARASGCRIAVVSSGVSCGAEVCQSVAVQANYMVAAWSAGWLDRDAAALQSGRSKSVVLGVHQLTSAGPIFCGNLPTPGVFSDQAFSVSGGDVRVTKIALDLERRGKVVVACACSTGATMQGAPWRVSALSLTHSHCFFSSKLQGFPSKGSSRSTIS